MRQRFDIVISGASFTGRAIALALANALGDSASIALVTREKKDEPTKPSPRAFAVAAASRNLLDAIGIWDLVEPHAQPVHDIEITDSPLEAGIRPVLLTYENSTSTGEVASHIVPDNVLSEALRARVSGTPHLSVLYASEATGFEATNNNAIVTIQSASGSQNIEADLVIAAEGRRSAMREGAAIRQIGWDYAQSGICTVVSHSQPHDGRATQHFLPSGPFAILPLPGNKCCITWTESDTEARRILELDAAAFEAEVDKRFGGRLGTIAVQTKPAAWPLVMRLARSLTAPRLALIGDTIRTVHPIAGQGLNLGLRDVAALTETIVDSSRIGLPPSNPDALRRYEQWRRFDSALSTAAFDSLNRLFANDNTLLRSVREAGLSLVDRLPMAKSLFVNEAAGLTGDVPKLLRGDAL